jgi:hypothetical protein
VNPETPPPDEPSTTPYAPSSAPLDGGGWAQIHRPVDEAEDPAELVEPAEDAWPQAYPPPEPPDPVDSPRNRILAGAGVALVVALLGVPLAYLWSSVAPWLPAQVSGNELLYADPTGEQRAGAESWFVLLMLGTGLVVGLAVWYGLRRFRGSVMVAALGIGATAAGWLTWRIGHNIGAGAVLEKERHAHDGQIILLPPALRVKSPGNVASWHGIPYVGGVLLYMALAAVATYVIAVLVTYSPALNRRRLPPGPPDADPA